MTARTAASGEIWVTAYVALGSNLGDRGGLLRAAVGALAATSGVRVEACSRFYETDAVADEPQPAYLNAVVRVGTSLAPRALLDHALAIEQSHGRLRPPGKKHAPRTLDLDLLLVGALVTDEPGLTLPHPHLLTRAFVRIPLADVAMPGLRHPVTGESLDRASDDRGVRLVDAARETW